MEHATDLLADLKKLETINRCYDLPVDSLHTLREKFNHSKVCIPLIGKFSSGKSALLNTLLGYSTKLLAENIAPETAVPTELEYVKADPAEPVTIFFKEKSPETCSLQDYLDLSLNAGSTERVHIQLNAPALAQFPDIQLVDMPGFESGLEVHNRAIDSYLGNSMAYLIVFPSDDMVMRSTIGNILKELCLHDMPLAIVITKCDKEDSNTSFAEKKASLSRSMTRYIGNRELDWCLTSSVDGEIEPLICFLRKVQDRAQELRIRKFQTLLKPEVDNTIRYLQSLLNGSALSQSELAAQADRLRAEMDQLQEKLSVLANDFRRAIPQCVCNISNETENALNDSADALIAMAINDQDVRDQINLIVRNAITRGVRKHYLPLVSQYIQDVGSVGVCTDLDTNISMEEFNLERNQIVGNIVAGVVALFFSLPGGIILSTFVNRLAKKKREEAENKIRNELRYRIIPQVLDQVEQSLTTELNHHAQSVEEAIQAQGSAQRANLEKSIADLQLRMAEEQEKKRQLAEVDRTNLKCLEEMRNAL